MKFKGLIAATAAVAALTGALVAPSNAVVPAAKSVATTARTTDYGSGVWAGPTGTYVQDAGWTNPNLKVGMVGDSETYRCQTQLRAAFANLGVTFALRGWAGANTANQNTWLESITYMPDILIGALGTNDVFNPFAMPGQIQRFKNAAGLPTEKVWVNTYVGRPATALHDLRNSGQVNNAIAAAFPADHVADWVGNLTAAVGRGVSLGTYIDPDGVHTTPAGCSYFAAVVANAVEPLL